MNASDPRPASSGPSLQRLPVALFAAVMGVTGLGLVWQLAGEVFGLDFGAGLGEVLVMAGAGVFIVLAAAYGRKAMRHPGAVRAEFGDPAAAGFFSTIPIGVLLLSAGWAEQWPAVASVMFWVSITAMLILAVVALARLFREPHPLEAATGGWLLAMVSPILVPLAAVPLGFPEMAMLCLGLGLAMWAVLMPVIVARFVIGQPLPPGLRPGWFILLVPPMVIFIGYLKVGGPLDLFAHALFAMGLLLAAGLMVAARDVAAWPFTVAWWAFTFPFDGVAAAALTYHQAMPTPVSLALAVAAVALATAIVAFVAVKTLHALATGRLLAPAPVPATTPASD